MPVTAQQTRLLRNHFGDTAADEIVDVLNNVEANSVTELRTLNELNFARFEAKMDLRFDAVDKRFDAFEARINDRFEAFDAKFEAKLKLGFAEQNARIAERFLAHTRWVLGGWTLIFLAIIGLWFRK